MSNESDDRNKNKFQSNRKYFTIAIYAVLTFTACVVIYKALNNWREGRVIIENIISMFSPFLIAFLIAYFVNPMVFHIDNLLFREQSRHRYPKIHTIISLVISYLVIVGFLAILVTVIVPQIVVSIGELVRQSSTLYANVLNNFNTFAANHPDLNLEYLQTIVDDSLPNIFTYVRQLLSDIVPLLYNAGMSVIGWVINLILAFVISCYIMWDKQNLLLGLKRIIYAALPEKAAYKFITIARESNLIFSRYIIGKAVDSLIIGILCFVLMWILGLPYAPLLSLVVGVTNMIPYFGPFIGAIPGILFLLIISPKSALIFGIMILVLQQFDGNILGPKILGSSTGLAPIWIIFAITVGGTLGGALGMFLGVPIVAVLSYLLNQLIDFFLDKRKIDHNLSNVVTPGDDMEKINRLKAEKERKMHRFKHFYQTIDEVMDTSIEDGDEQDALYDSKLDETTAEAAEGFIDDLPDSADEENPL